MFLKRSKTRNSATFPAKDLIRPFMLVYGAINRRAAGLTIEASSVAGPEPMDLPKRIMSLAWISMSEIKYFITPSASRRICSAQALPG